MHGQQNIKKKKSVEEIQVSLCYDENNGYFTWRCMYIYDNISLISSQIKKCFGQKLQWKSKHTFYCQYSFPLKSCPLWNDMEKYGMARQATDDNVTRRVRFACWITTATDTHS